jgi:hypothetical protein
MGKIIYTKIIKIKGVEKFMLCLLFIICIMRPCVLVFVCLY